MRLDGKVCLVTGSGSGIGRATAQEMARQGAEAVIVTDVNDEPGAETVELVRGLGVTAEYRRCDVSDSGQVSDTMDWVAERFGRLDVLHNNAAIVDTQITAR